MQTWAGTVVIVWETKKGFPDTREPAWVEEWISKRTEKQAEKAEKPGKPVDETAQAKRQQVRKEKVRDGMEELLLWIKDIVRNGIIGIPEKGNGWFENMARRMIDAQAPGLAGMIRSLGNTPFYKEGWQTDFMDQLVCIYLVIQGYKNTLSIDEFLRADVHSMVGFTQDQEELKEQKGITDTWRCWRISSLTYTWWRP
jgi:hypothetical protein